jgi:hypothetical protein
MNLTLRPLYFTLCFFSFCSIAFAQRNLSEGYIVRNNGDTIRGFIGDRPEYQLWRSVQFKTQKKDRQFQDLGTGDIRALEYNGALYRPITFNNSQVDTPGVYSGFGKLLVEGYYELYHVYQDNESYFVVRQDTTTYFLYEKTDDNGVIIPGSFQNLLNFFSSDCPVNKEVLRVQFTEKALSEFMMGVNACLGKGAAAVGVSHFHNAPAKLNFVLFAGGIPGNSKSQTVIDGALRLSFPQWDRRASLNLGFRYTSITSSYNLINYSNQNFTVKATDKISSIPFTFQYNLFSGIIQPYPLVGFSYAFSTISAPYVSPQSLSSNSNDPPFSGSNSLVAVIYGGGVEIHPFKELFIRSEFRYETRSQYFVFGLGYKF